MKASITKSLYGLFAACALLSILMGCGGKKEDSSGTAAPASSGSGGANAVLNNPNVPEAEKERVRKSLGQSGGAAAPGSTGGAAGSTGQ